MSIPRAWCVEWLMWKCDMVMVCGGGIVRVCGGGMVRVCRGGMVRVCGEGV